MQPNRKPPKEPRLNPAEVAGWVILIMILLVVLNVWWRFMVWIWD